MTEPEGRGGTVSNHCRASPSPARPPPRAQGLRAGIDGVFIVSQTSSRKETHTMFFARWLRTLRSARLSRRTEPSRPAPRFRPRLEALEDRAVPAQLSLTVSSLADSGAGTLRAAILTADAGSHS